MIIRYLKRPLIAAFLSLIIVFAMMENFRFITSPREITTYDRIIGVLWAPAELILDAFEGKAPILDRFWKLLIVSLIFYSAALWILILIYGFIRDRRKHGK
jgi:hypothetical protein